MQLPPFLSHLQYGYPESLETVVVEARSSDDLPIPEHFAFVCFPAKYPVSHLSLFLPTSLHQFPSWFFFSVYQISISSWMLFVCSPSSSFPFPHPLFFSMCTTYPTPLLLLFLLFASLFISLCISTPKHIYLITTWIGIRSVCCLPSLSLVLKLSSIWFYT